MNKSDLRKQARKVREDIPSEKRAVDEHALADNILMFLGGEAHDVTMIGLYYPYGSEIKIPMALDGYETCLPVIRDKITLEYYAWREGDKLTQTGVVKDFNIPIPDTRGKSPVSPQVILVPLLMCDEHGTRLGQGAGHYDRYYASCDQKPIMVGVCFEEQIYQGRLPVEAHDARLDWIITPQRFIKSA